jgi:hypothetical protein
MAGCRQLPAIVSLVTCLGAQAAPSVPQLLPVDEAPRRPDFLAFRQELQAIVERRDVPALLKVLDPNIKVSFGGGDGIDGFKKKWKLDSNQSDVWNELGWVLAHGGTFEETDAFRAPYVYSRWPEKFDPFEHVAVVGSQVRIRSAAAKDAPIIETLTYAIVQLDLESDSQGQWTAIKLTNGRAGFVASQLLRSPVDYRAFFNRVDGRWRMTAFVAGD